MNFPENYSGDDLNSHPMFGLHPSSYAEVARRHAETLDPDEARRMFASFTRTLDTDFKIFEVLDEAQGILYAVYTAHLYLEIFHQLYDKSQRQLKQVDELNRLLDL